VLEEGRRHARAHARVRARLRELTGIDVVTWLAAPDGGPVERRGTGPPPGEDLEAVVERAGAELRFRPGTGVEDLRGREWELDGDAAVLGEVRDGRFTSDAYPDALGRLWTALVAPYAGDVLVSLADRYECVDWGDATHVGGGSHGSLHRDDSLGPLLMVGLDQAVEPREQWTLRDVSALVLEHFGVAGSPVHESGCQPAIPLAEGREPATPLAELPNDSVR
jgi:hypothetical protein